MTDKKSKLNIEKQRIQDFYHFLRITTALSTPDDERSSSDYDVNIVEPVLKSLFTKIFQSASTAKILLNCLQTTNFRDITSQLNDADIPYNLEFMALDDLDCMSQPILKGIRAILYNKPYTNSLNDKCRADISVRHVFTNKDYEQIHNFLKGNHRSKYRSFVASKLSYVRRACQLKNHLKTLKKQSLCSIIMAIIVPIIAMSLWSVVFSTINSGLYTVCSAFLAHFTSWTLIDRIILIIVCEIPLFYHIHKLRNKIRNKISTMLIRLSDHHMI